jgi:hypothetical protein
MPATRRRDRQVATGTINTVLLTLLYDVVFADAGYPDFPDASYIVRFDIPAVGITLGSVSNKTPSGFRVTFAAVIGGTLGWAAIEQLS